MNNFYNFKNAIRHFICIDMIDFPFEDNEISIEKLSWTEPINFRIKKENDKYRILKIPNILNFICAYEKFKSYNNFTNTSNLDGHKRLVPNVETGDFATGSYDFRLEEDFKLLSIYDNLIKLDIKSFYGRIYTHHIEFENSEDERYITNLNLGNTNGLIMSNYISLYFAEKYLKEISNIINEKLHNENIDCSFSYFSDDFYFFCNKKDNQKIIDIFDKVLEKYDLERNSAKIELWDYMEYNNYNLTEKYWRKIISESKARFNEEISNNKLYFLNQLIYRMSNLKDDRQRKTFLTTFFKSTYFNQIDLRKYKMEDYNFHQVCYMYRFCPEIILYSINKFKNFSYFKGNDFKKFLQVRYKESLNTSYNEEQLYYYYAIKVLGFESILEDTNDNVIESNNQVLISYYLKDGIFTDNNIKKLKLNKSEHYWFQNYHLILFTNLINEDKENLIKEYLMPNSIRNNPTNRVNIKNKQDVYINFYKSNLEDGNSIINNVDKINESLEEYIELKIEERIEVFGDNGE
ncbi:hypothetical protein [uncultured Clostridium sp.]|uniref:hypothetical protein n=1 Tax=uncultured Clostridium sp. TaxID=59620 RepID=UPI00280AF9FC|nr:hypothetical protein [uncultured Clostridium sp.]